MFLFKRSFSSECLKKYTVPQLKSVAILSGVASSGNKPEIIDRLSHHFTTTSTPTRSVLSFDLGYRNLAYCHLDHEANVLDWAKIDLDLPSFHPSVVAPIIREFIDQNVIKNLKTVDKVLVEQQRARTGGAHAVLENTLRVNCVEAILWCGLYEATESIQRDIQMMPIPRQSVDRAWQLELDAIVAENPARFLKIKQGYYQKKQASALLVQKWLDTNTTVQCNQEFKTIIGLVQMGKIHQRIY
ncbi:hypothetical protein CU098_005413 [Rhizopus stolonifer]|uniref:SAP domain-containing protein n=1 Tax=Rhizopus stolonifer TaxID=4846 RepID=A0A367IK33_RHIST|nr:hypothetical protein CU098_005413 [Rhizopus stolonifer]